MENIIIGLIYTLVSLAIGLIYSKMIDCKHLDLCLLYGLLTMPSLWIVGEMVKIMIG